MENINVTTPAKVGNVDTNYSMSFNESYLSSGIHACKVFAIYKL